MFPFPNVQHLFDSSFSGQFEAIPAPPKPNRSPPFFPFSPPVLDGLHELLLATQLQPRSDIVEAAPPPPIDPPPNKDTATAPPLQGKSSRWKSMGRKRATRKDRHSKIFTAQGARDRRMRLSLEVARKFFDLQDLLGFDKPSKTVQWLLTKSESAIEAIAGTSSRPKGLSFGSSINSSNSESFTSECEDVSTISDYKGKSSATTIINEGKIMNAQPLRKAAIHPALARESRAKARARARERTREKRRMHWGLLEGDERLNQLVESSIPFYTVEEESISQDPKSSLELAAERELYSSSPSKCRGHLGETVFASLSVAVGSGSSPVFDYHLNSISSNDTANIIEEQWDMHFSSNIEERVLLGDVQTHTKLWETYNSPIL